METYCAGKKWIIRDDGEENFFSQSGVLQLKFVNSLSLPIYTGTRIMRVDNSSLEIALINELNGKYVDFEPESSAKVEILVLEGDFDGEDRESWTCDAFCNNILREREGRKPLLAGDVVLNLEDGVSLVGEIYFTDNSSWTRLGAINLGSGRELWINVLQIEYEKPRPNPLMSETTVESFFVSAYEKHHPPMLSDKVWRLVKIGKDGAFHSRLSQENINTVKDFFTLIHIDAPKFWMILGTGMYTKIWEVIIKHVQTCILDTTMYLYQSLSSPEKVGVFFNVVGQLLGIVADRHSMSTTQLSPHSITGIEMFYFFESHNKTDPDVIWLTGGPGCSSELAMFYENGPFTITNNLSLIWNEYGWDKASNLLYVDQPIGASFSFISDKRDICHNEKGVSDDFYDFLQNLLDGSS